MIWFIVLIAVLFGFGWGVLVGWLLTTPCPPWRRPNPPPPSEPLRLYELRAKYRKDAA